MALSTEDKKYEGQTDESFPELFDIRAMLPQPSKLKPGQLAAEHIRRYFEDVSSVLPVTVSVVKFTGLHVFFR